MLEYTEECLAESYFTDWYEANNKYKLLHSECVEYKVPLFLNGREELDNLEV